MDQATWFYFHREPFEHWQWTDKNIPHTFFNLVAKVRKGMVASYKVLGDNASDQVSSYSQFKPSRNGSTHASKDCCSRRGDLQQMFDGRKLPVSNACLISRWNGPWGPYWTSSHRTEQRFPSPFFIRSRDFGRYFSRKASCLALMAPCRFLH